LIPDTTCPRAWSSKRYASCDSAHNMSSERTEGLMLQKRHLLPLTPGGRAADVTKPTAHRNRRLCGEPVDGGIVGRDPLLGDKLRIECQTNRLASCPTNLRKLLPTLVQDLINCRSE